MAPPAKRGLDVVISNWSNSRLPVPRRVAVAARNLALRVFKRDNCCGHHGEPGC